MQPLDKTLRNKLECTVEKAKDSAEQAARTAIEQLGVGEAKPYAYLTEAQRQLRVKLRAHGRHLGDHRDPQTKTQAIENLVEETAYEHWHRMLFARFLAENNLLMYPDPDDPVAITLEECEDLAAEEGAANGWELAASYATRMLPQIFRIDSPVFELSFPPEHQQKLENLLSDLQQEVFTASDSLGWVYQFWQKKRKEAVNQSGVKIGAKELPAVTQLFTEPYMVSFLLDNSLGAWWAGKQLSEEDLTKAETEEELRQNAALPGMPLEYLRFVKEDNGKWTPAAGTFDSWPQTLEEFKVMDPCCGSGHFLVAVFHMLVPIRMEMEGLSVKEAVDAVLRDNLHGLEIDKRCVELAAFALAMSAWRYPSAQGYRVLPKLKLACSGLSVRVAKVEWRQLAAGNRNLGLALELMHDFFNDAPVLGSLLDPTKTDSAKLIQRDELSAATEQALKQEQSEEQQEATVVAQKLAKAVTLLSDEYHWVVTNVPYLSRSKQNDVLRNFADKCYPLSKNDLSTIFLERCIDLCTNGGFSSVVLPQNWLFLSRYKNFRKKLLKNNSWHLLVRLGSGAFETISGEVVKAILITISRDNKQSDFIAESIYRNKIRGLDVSEIQTVPEKSFSLQVGAIKSIEQSQQKNNPDSRVLFSADKDEKLLNQFCDSRYGLRTGDGARFIAKFWEIPWLSGRWVHHQSTVQKTTFFGGREHYLFWDGGNGGLAELANVGVASLQGADAWGKYGIAISLTGELRATLYRGDKYDNNCAAVWPLKNDYLPAIWSYCSSSSYSPAVRELDQNLKVTNATLLKVAFDIDHWTKVAQEKYPRGLPAPFSNDPTQWIFHGHPCGCVIWDEENKHLAHGRLRNDMTVLQVAVSRLLGYHWPAETDPEMELSDESRQWIKKCEALLPYADEDGLVCIPAVRGEPNAEERLTSLLAKAYGNEWSTSKLNELLAGADHAGKSLESWLRDKFFIQHCKLFHHRPFIWQIWDGLRDGFSVLVNYHKLDYKLLETLIYTYLGDWITRQKDNIAEGEDGAQERLAAAQALKKKLELILEGEKPYDIFVRWKPLEQQPIGWNPDLNDGVRLNIRPFMTVPAVRKKGAGVLRDKPNIKWTKDRGKDVPSAPWYHLGPEYGGNEGDRINDHHLSRAEKQAARKNVT